LEHPRASDLSALLRRKRKTRPQRACQPCRLRKVKCNYNVPCTTCVERHHPELCSIENDEQPPKRSAAAASAADSDEPWTPSKSEWYQMCTSLSSVEQSLRQLQHDMGLLLASRPQPSGIVSSGEQSPETSAAESGTTGSLQGLPNNSSLSEHAVYLGGNSVPAMVVALGLDDDKDAVKELLGKSILPVFGLDNESATYPFVDLWGVPHGSVQRIQLLSKLLPADADCIQIFRQYRDTAHVIYPGLIDIVQFEGDLSVFLSNRRNGLTSQTSQAVFGRDLHWLGLIFAVLASGFQCSSLPRKERQMKSQVYGIQSQLHTHCQSRANMSSLLCLRMSPYRQLPVTRNFNRHSEPTLAGECDIEQHECWCCVVATWYTPIAP
jgi:hypothetical protein